MTQPTGPLHFEWLFSLGLLSAIAVLGGCDDTILSDPDLSELKPPALSVLQMDNLLEQAEQAIEEHVAEADYAVNLRQPSAQLAIQVAIWRDGNRVGRGWSASSGDLQAAVSSATRAALRNVADNRRLTPVIALVDLHTAVQPNPRRLGVDAWVLSADGQTIDVYPPTYPIEELRDFEAVTKKLRAVGERRQTEGATLVLSQVRATQFMRGPNREPAVLEAGIASRRAESTETAITHALRASAAWLYETRQYGANPPIEYDPLIGSLRSRDINAIPVEFYALSAALRARGFVSYLDHKKDMDALANAVRILAGEVACSDCDLAAPLYDEALALVALSSSEHASLYGVEIVRLLTSVESKLRDKAADSQLLEQTSDLARCMLGAEAAAGVPSQVVVGVDTAPRILHSTSPMSQMWEPDELIALHLIDLLRGKTVCSDISKAALLHESDLHLTPTEHLAAQVLSESHEPNSTFARRESLLGELLSRQLRYEDAYACNDTHLCVGGVRSLPADGKVTLSAWIALNAALLELSEKNSN